MNTKVPSAWQVGRVLDIVREMRERQIAKPAIDNDEGDLRTIYPDWAETRTTVDPADVLLRLVRAAIEANSMADAIKLRLADLKDRQARYDRRHDEYRASITLVMQALELDRFTDTDATVTLRPNRGGAVLITNEAALADEYVRVTRSPDKAKIGADLKAGVVVEGATLSQGGSPILSITAR